LEGAGFLFGAHNVKMASGNLEQDRGFTLLEVLIAAVVMAIILMGLISSITGSFLATDMANKASEAQATARRLLEEASELSYSAILLLNGNSLITTDGVAAKFQVYETTPGLLTLEVEVCRPTGALTLSQLSTMTMAQFHALSAQDGSRVRFTTLNSGLMPKQSATQGSSGSSGSTGAPGSGSGGGNTGSGGSSGGGGLFW
jgi:prepilin-type N-terminal cleavage/methylation domain-containing protein